MRGTTGRAAGLAIALLGAWLFRPVLWGEALAGRDVFRMAIPDSAFILESLRRWELPLWLPFSRLGQPFLATLQSQAVYLPRVLATFLFGPVWAPTAEQVFHTALAVSGAWVAARALGSSRLASATAGAAFGLSHLMVMLAAEPNMAGAAAWSGWIVAAARAPRDGRRAAALTALAVGASLLCGSPETTLWQGAMALACARGGGRGRWLALALGSLWGAAVAAIAVIPGLELAAHSARAQGHEAILAWSASVTQLLAMAVPHADWPRSGYGDGEQWLLLSTFAGALPCALAAWISVRGRRAWIRPVMALSIALLLLSLGEHFAPSAALLEWTPLRWFRYPAKYLVGAAFGIALLTGAAVDRFAAAIRRRQPSARGSAAVLVVMAAAAAAARSWLPPAVWLVAFAGVAWLLPQALPRRARRHGRALLAALVFLELVTAQVALGGPAFVSADRLDEPSELATLVRTPHGRVSLDVQGRLDRAPAPEGVLEFIARSRVQLVPNRHVEEGLLAVEGYGTPEPERTDVLLERGAKGALDLTGVEWVVRAHRSPARNPDPFPRARWLGEAQKYTDDEALDSIRADGEGLREEAMLAEGDDSLESDCETPPVEWVTDEARVVEVAVDACGPGYLLLADRWYPGWRATVDGVEAPIYRSDYAVRAVPLREGGRHVVRFEYRPWSVRIGAWLSAAAVAAAVALALRSRGRAARTPPP